MGVLAKSGFDLNVDTVQAVQRALQKEGSLKRMRICERYVKYFESQTYSREVTGGEGCLAGAVLTRSEDPAERAMALRMLMQIRRRSK